MSHPDRDVVMCRKFARFYAARGYQPLPSCPVNRHPPFPYAAFWEKRFERDPFERFETPCVQLMCGRYWGLLVIDLDGPEALEAWRRLCPYEPRTWVSHSGGGGRHVWFSVPADYPHALPYATLWRPDPSKPRQKGEPAVERLCDRRLVVAPPSIHPRTGNRYRFVRGSCPWTVARPAPVPAWVLAIRPAEPERQPFVPPRPCTAPPRPPRDRPGDFPRARDVLDRIPDKAALAASWGLRLASSTPNGAGWLRCRAVGREDRNPSASFHAASGTYWEAGAGSVRFLDLAVLLGAYPDWRDALDDLAGRHGFAPPRRRPLPEPEPRRTSS